MGTKTKNKTKKYIEDYKNEINKNIEAIPQENLKEPTMSVVGPAMRPLYSIMKMTTIKKCFQN